MLGRELGDLGQIPTQSQDSLSDLGLVILSMPNLARLLEERMEDKRIIYAALNSVEGWKANIIEKLVPLLLSPNV